MYDNYKDSFITTFHRVLLAPDLCNILFSSITLVNLVHNCLFHKWFCTVYFGDKEKDEVTLPHIAHMKHAFWEEIKQMSKSKIIAPRNKVTLELLHNI